jgi:hypothetical protein
MPAAAYLDTLNIQQRQAVEHGVLENDCTRKSFQRFERRHRVIFKMRPSEIA